LELLLSDPPATAVTQATETETKADLFTAAVVTVGTEMMEGRRRVAEPHDSLAESGGTQVAFLIA
jgi:hypothetical protein